MKTDKNKLNCYVQNGGDIVGISIMLTNNKDYPVSCHEIRSNDLNDSFNTYDGLIEAYGDTYYDSLDDYKRDKIKKFADWFSQDIKKIQ